MTVTSTTRLPVVKVKETESIETSDVLAIEEPLEIRLKYDAEEKVIQNISVTMRTPGHDAELALGFLFTEGIIRDQCNVFSVEHCYVACSDNRENIIQVNLKEGVMPNLGNTQRNFYTTSSCGVCGKASINAIRTVSQFDFSRISDNSVSTETLYHLPEILSRHQHIFTATGGLHATALFNSAGELLLVREDVGRHNALDKLIGAALDKELLPLDKHVLLLSGRASFELVQKAAMAGINIIAAVGAPSSLAIQLAEEFNITLIGFLRGSRFNIYTAPGRVSMQNYENTY